MDMMKTIKFILALFIVGSCLILAVTNWGTPLGMPYLLACCGWTVALLETTGKKTNDRNSQANNG
jgi:hypothetical protein